MRVQRRISELVTVEVEGSQHDEIFDGLASLEEAFGEKACGKCKGEALCFVVRENKDGDKFYEMHCKAKDCRAKLRMSMRKKGGNLYPKRKAGKNYASGLEQDAWLPNNGWMIWDKTAEKER